MRGRRLRALDNLFRRQVLVGGAVRVKLYDREGRVTYSNDHALIGTLHAAKDARTGVGLYAFARDHHSPQRLQLVAELRRAIGAGELVCFYQPQAVLATGLLCGAEALVRWRHPTRGLSTPRRSSRSPSEAA